MKSTAMLPIIFFLFSCFESFIINYCFLKSKLINCLINKHNPQRWANVPKSTYGGLSFFFTICSVLLLLWLINIDSLPFYLLFPLTISACFGFIDDIHSTPPIVKFIGQILAAFCLIYNGMVISISNESLLNNCFTILWVVGMMNSVNMLDNMDGIVSSVSLVSLGLALMIIFSSKTQSLTDIVLITAVMGALISFLYFNWNPAKIYMGDTGSQFLGAFLAWVSIQYFWQFRDFTEGGIQIKQFLIPALAFTVSLMDTVTVTLRRLARGVSPFVGGRDHTTHHLAYLGIKDKNVVRILIAVSIVAAMVAYNISDILVSPRWHWSYSLATIIFYLTIFFGLQYFYEVAKQKINSPKVSESKEMMSVEGYDEVLN
jgi:UDP-GlcNAc:undecaprenyl-phosphate/decaprenyl-phosphate GlcNAc-1-phosphate transferase